MTYYIFHPIGGSMNHFCDCNTYMYELIHSVEANSFEEAFRLGQNDFNEEYAKIGVRSTSVGDIIQSTDDIDKLQCHLVKGMGFQTVPNTWLTHIDWGFAPIPNDSLIIS